jgi:hypothetical protein
MAKKKRLLMALRLNASSLMTFGSQEQAQLFHELVKKAIVKSYKKAVGFPKEVDMVNFDTVSAEFVGLVPAEIMHKGSLSVEAEAEPESYVQIGENWYQEFGIEEWPGIVGKNEREDSQDGSSSEAETATGS